MLLQPVTVTCTGLFMFSSVPLPNCPGYLYPHIHKVPSVTQTQRNNGGVFARRYFGINYPGSSERQHRLADVRRHSSHGCVPEQSRGPHGIGS